MHLYCRGPEGPGMHLYCEGSGMHLYCEGSDMHLYCEGPGMHLYCDGPGMQLYCACPATGQQREALAPRGARLAGIHMKWVGGRTG